MNNRKMFMIFFCASVFCTNGFCTATVEVASNHTVDDNACVAEVGVYGVQSRADTDQAVLTVNGQQLTDVSNNRADAPSSPCSNLDSSVYVGCGYISSNGTNGTPTWVKIAK